MSLTADSALFDSAVRHLFHLPETLEKLGFPASAVRPHDAHRGNGRGRNGEEGVGLRSAPVDILESHKEYTFVIDVPGLSKSDIQVTLEDEKILVIKSSGKRKRDDGEEEGCRYLLLERSAPVKFLRKFRLPEDASSSGITAKCENGVLTVVVGKIPPPEPKTRTVEVTIA
ncbi:unnamed protein product [Musa acuminata subsp. malaccensis]|uniref:(wild Malaysian banana) hypothetical protein n=1 Tax=Musa acuminata subsp. malaccensis TaxID=214687 RepID=A0A804KA94_MUSAM|nr:PREDICTED: 18.6 kDa class III heat shock protein [Musa acuminata subsp. malaccensis]CAG1832601.1 unnamed protein product [Musa acuminata subsp. malaccensis]